MPSSSIFDSGSDEQSWITQISEILEKEVRVEIDIPVSIFRVPKNLSVFNPKAYEPQLIGLGPYHHFRTELYEMERYKLAAASRVQKEFQSIGFKQLVEKLIEFEHEMRACYHKYLEIEGDTLGWIMAIDGLFLLDFLSKFVNQMNEKANSSSTTAQLIDSSGKKLNHDAILGDILMLENQIPIFLLSKILLALCPASRIDDSLLPSVLFRFCSTLSPIKPENALSLSQVCSCAHLLDLLYHMIVPTFEGHQDTQDREDASSFFVDYTSRASVNSSHSHQVFTKLWSTLSSLNVGFVSKITNSIKNIIGAGTKLMSSLPGIPFSSSKENKSNFGEDETKPPIVEEIMVPSVTDLFYAGVSFSPTSGGISTLKFDPTTMIFYLPVLTLDVNSEIVMRNLVAYEASAMSDSLVFTRYMELMNGIIDTVDDAKLLREKKIIINSLKSDMDVADFFNGMSKSVRLSKVPFIDRTIADVNRYFDNMAKVRIYKSLKAYVYGSWQILTLLAVILLMLLMALQSFCSVYSCPKLFNTDSTLQ